MSQLIVNVGSASRARDSESVRDGFIKVNSNFTEMYSSIATLTASLNGKANLLSPQFTGTPTAPNVAGGDNSTKIANTAFCVALFNTFVSSMVGALVFQTSWDASSGTFPATSAAGGAVKKGFIWKVSVTGTVDGVLLTAGDELYAIVDNPSTTVYAGNWLKVEGSITLAEVQAAVGFTFGAAAALNVGTSVGNVVQVITGGKLPALDGSLLTNLPGSSAVTASQISDASANGRSLITANNYAAMRTLLSLGTAASLDVGTAANKVVQLDAAGKYPAADGSQITGISAGKLISRAYSETATATNITTLIPQDNTIPQDNEGVEVLTAVITPSNAANRIRCSFSGSGHSTGSYPNFCVAMFRSGQADALIAKNIAAQYSGGAVDVTLCTEFVAGGTSAITISIRAGAYYNGGMTLNSYGGYKELGAAQKSTLIVEEITP